MLIKTVFAGFGGQGVLSMGRNLAQAAMIEERNVTYFPSYGAEVRGGTANCTVVISDEEISSPIASAPSFVIVMNEPSLDRFQNQVQSGGLLFVNSSLVDTEIARGDIDVIRVPANETAEKLANPASANMVMLGAFIKKSNMVSTNAIFEGLRQLLENRKKVLHAAEKALTAGYELI